MEAGTDLQGTEDEPLQSLREASGLHAVYGLVQDMLPADGPLGSASGRKKG